MASHGPHLLSTSMWDLRQEAMDRFQVLWGMISWYQEQGCEISLNPEREREIWWRDQSAKVEFWLRWG